MMQLANCQEKTNSATPNEQKPNQKTSTLEKKRILNVQNAQETIQQLAEFSIPFAILWFSKFGTSYFLSLPNYTEWQKLNANTNETQQKCVFAFFPLHNLFVLTSHFTTHFSCPVFFPFYTTYFCYFKCLFFFLFSEVTCSTMKKI